MKKRNREISIFSMSALDLFASALGAFIIIAVALIPYYKKTIVDVESENRVLRAEVEELKAKLDTCSENLADANNTIEALRERIEDLVARNEELAKENEAKDREIASKNAELEAKERELESAAADLEKASSEISKLKVKDLEIVFVMDTTGSLDSELDDLKSNLLGIVRVLDRIVPNLSVGFVAYRDFPENYTDSTPPDDDYVTRVFPLTKITASSFDNLQNFVNKLEAKGGGDLPEAAQVGLQKANEMNWSEETDKVIIIIGDVSAHDENIQRCNDIVFQFINRNPNARVSAIYATENPEESHQKFFEDIADKGNGSYVHDKGRMLESILLSIL